MFSRVRYEIMDLPRFADWLGRKVADSARAVEFLRSLLDTRWIEIPTVIVYQAVLMTGGKT